MLRAIVDWQQDQVGDWVAILECGHGQHVRHVPPLADRGWVLTEDGRARFIGFELVCVRCEAGEPPIFEVKKP